MPDAPRPADAGRHLRLFGLALFAAGVAGVWGLFGAVLWGWLTGEVPHVSFGKVWAVGLIGGLSGVAGALVFVRLTVGAVPVDPNRGPPVTGAAERTVRRWCTWLHVSALSGYLLPFAHIALPVVIWLSKRHLHPTIDLNGRVAFDFQISITLFALVGLLLSVLVVGLALMLAVAAVHIIMTVVAAYRAARGELPGYPFTLGVLRGAGI